MTSDTGTAGEFFTTRIPPSIYRRNETANAKRSLQQKALRWSDATPAPARMGLSSSSSIGRRDSPEKLVQPGKPAVSSIRVSVNLRYSRRNDPLLPFDIFCSAPAGATLAEVYSKTAKIDPDGSMTKFRLRTDKGIIVNCEDAENNGYAYATNKCQEILHMRPVRLIFCVADARRFANNGGSKLPTMAVNVRVEGSSADLLAEDLVVETPSRWHVSDVWKAVQEWDKEMEKHNVLCLSTRRPIDGVALRIGLAELISDVAAIGGNRYIFEIVQPPDVEHSSSGSEEEEEEDSSDSESDDENDDYSQTYTTNATRKRNSFRSRHHGGKGHHRK